MAGVIAQAPESRSNGTAQQLDKETVVYSSLARALKFPIYRAGAALILGAACLTSPAQSKKTAPKAPSKPPASSSSHSGVTGSHGANAGSHGPTTANHGPTTGSPGGARTTTTAGARTATTGGRSGAGPSAGGRGATGGAGTRTPAGSHEVRTANGSTVRTRANGSRSDIHDAKRGMDIHHGLNGNRRVSVERADHSRVVAVRGGRGYVQHPYMYHGHEFAHRTYYYNGRAYDRYYGHYYYGGAYLDVYAPGYYYGPGFYGWAYNPWAAPISYAWGWGGNPWYGYYGGYFTPYPVYSSASLWLTDYLISNSLAAAYQAQVAAQAASGDALQAGAAPLTPETKQLVADEVQRQVALENSEAQQNAQGQDTDPGSSGIARMLSDNQTHVFVAGSDLDLVDAGGQECAISQGDVLEVATPPPAGADSATAVVLSTKGGKECAKSDNVSVAFTDLQDMQNHMRESIDQGLGDLQAKQGKGGLPQAPPSAQAPPVKSAYAAVAPPPDPNAASEIQQESQQADQSEQEVAGSAPQASAQPAPAAAAPSAPITVALGQTPDQVKSALGAPKNIIDLGTKKIYVYQDMKVTFKAGKVSDVQ
jgi:hypothetical protein